MGAFTGPNSWIQIDQRLTLPILDPTKHCLSQSDGHGLTANYRTPVEVRGFFTKEKLHLLQNDDVLFLSINSEQLIF